MKATVIYDQRDIRLEEVPDPTLHEETDAIVQVVAACVCGGKRESRRLRHRPFLLLRQHVRVPLADGTLVATPEVPDDKLISHLLTLSDVMGTGHHAAISAGVTQGRTVAVVGNGEPSQGSWCSGKRDDDQCILG